MWLLYANLDSVPINLVIRTYILVHVCERTTRNYFCNTKFLANVTKYDAIKKLCIKIFKLQELIRKKYKVYVDKNTTKRVRARILNEIKGDHIIEFWRILDYKDELLRIILRVLI